MFKKGVKFLLTVLPTQTTAQAGEPTEATILFDGRTFTLTFSQTAGGVGINWENLVVTVRGCKLCTGIQLKV